MPNIISKYKFDFVHNNGDSGGNLLSFDLLNHGGKNFTEDAVAHITIDQSIIFRIGGDVAEQSIATITSKNKIFYLKNRNSNNSVLVPNTTKIQTYYNRIEWVGFDNDYVNTSIPSNVSIIYDDSSLLYINHVPYSGPYYTSTILIEIVVTNFNTSKPAYNQLID